MRGKKIYMSTVTDPYQPIEKELKLTRGILKELVEYHQTRLVIQTRSSLVTRDIDLLQDFKEVVQVNMTITTDNEKVRKAFEPLCPNNKVRLKTIRDIQDAGIQSCITMTPLLPIDDPDSFTMQLLDTGVKRSHHTTFSPQTKESNVRGTREIAQQIVQEMDWNMQSYYVCRDTIKKYIPQLGEGKEGFKPI